MGRAPYRLHWSHPDKVLCLVLVFRRIVLLLLLLLMFLLLLLLVLLS